LGHRQDLVLPGLCEEALRQKLFHAKAQSKAAKAQRKQLFFFAPLWLGFVPLREINLEIN
jgi:hypothetical protein